MTFIRDEKSQPLSTVFLLLGFHAVTTRICVVVAVKTGLIRQVFVFS